MHLHVAQLQIKPGHPAAAERGQVVSGRRTCCRAERATIEGDPGAVELLRDDDRSSRCALERTTAEGNGALRFVQHHRRLARLVAHVTDLQCAEAHVLDVVGVEADLLTAGDGDVLELRMRHVAQVDGRATAKIRLRFDRLVALGPIAGTGVGQGEVLQPYARSHVSTPEQR